MRGTSGTVRACPALRPLWARRGHLFLRGGVIEIMSSFNEAERERIHTVISTVLENKALLLTPAPQASSFPRVLVAVMEAAAQYTDMTGLQKQALAKNAMNKIVKHHAPGLAPYLPLVDALCNEIVQAARQRFVFRRKAACFPCCRRV